MKSKMTHGAEPTSRRRSKVVFILVAVLSVAGGMVSATQWIAHQYAYQLPEALELSEVWGYALQGSGVAGLVIAVLLLRLPARRRYSFTAVMLSAYPLALSLGEVYPPHLFAKWIFFSGFDAWVTQQAAYGFSAGALLTFIGFLPAAFESKPEPSTSAGSAAWGTGEELKKKESEGYGRDSLLIGRGEKTLLDCLLLRDKGPLLHYEGDKHLVTVAPSRTGKGTGSVIPNSLSWGGGLVCHDSKGEIWHTTHRFRTRKLRQECVALDPFGVVGGLAAYNPLDRILPSDDSWTADTRQITELLILSSPNETNPHWNDSAKALISGLVRYVTKKFDVGDRRRSLPEVRRIITQEDITPTLRDMQSMGGLCEAAANVQLGRLDKSPKEAGSIISTAQTQLTFLEDEMIEEVLEPKTTFDVDGLARGDLSLYITMPPKYSSSYKGWMRLVLGSLLYAQTEPTQQEDDVLFLLDEAAELGHMDILESMASIIAGYQVTLWLFYQSISQMKSAYGENWQIFLANAGVLQVFQNSDLETAKYISELAGDQTLLQKGLSSGRTHEGLERKRSENTSLRETGRPLLTPDELRRLHELLQVLIVNNRFPVKARKLRYFEDPEFEGLYDPNPLH